MGMYFGWCLVLLALGRMVDASNQSQLLKDLFTNYYQGIVPYCSDQDKGVNVGLGIAIRSLINVDEPTQIIDINAWVRMSWTDCQLVWNASEYDGINELVVPYDKIWVPDVTLYDNNQDGDQGTLPGLTDFRPQIKSDGSIHYHFPTVLHSMCTIDSTYFPFDTQTCPLKFGSWSYDGLHVDVKNISASADTSAFKKNSEWKLVSIKAVHHELFYSCCEAPFPDVTFYLTISRRHLSFVVNILVPCLMIVCLALVGFLLPVEAGEKVSLEITVLLALAVYAQVVSDQLPPSSNLPYMGVFFACALFMTTISLVMAVLVVNLHHRGELGFPVPKVVRCIVFNGLAKIVLFDVDEQDEEEQFSKSRNSVGKDKKFSSIDLEMEEMKLCPNNTKVPKTSKKYKKEDDQNSNPVPTACSNDDILVILKDQFRNMSYIKDLLVNIKNRDDRMKSDWANVSIVIDRFCFLLMTILTVFATASVAILMS